MKKLISGLSALAIMAMPLTAFADTTIDQDTPEPKQGEAVITTEIAPAYIVTIPTDTAVKFNTENTDFGAVELTKAQLDPGKAVKVTLTTDNKLENKADETKSLAYTIFEGKGEAVTDKVFAAAFYQAVGDKTDLTVNITQDDWNKAYAGKYSDTVTFNVSYEDAPAAEPEPVPEP